MSNHMHQSPINYNTVRLFEIIRDLGLYFDTKLAFKQHIDLITKSARNSLGFTIRNCKYFEKYQSFKMLIRRPDSLALRICITCLVSILAQSKIPAEINTEEVH